MKDKFGISHPMKQTPGVKRPLPFFQLLLLADDWCVYKLENEGVPLTHGPNTWYQVAIGNFA